MGRPGAGPPSNGAGTEAAVRYVARTATRRGVSRRLDMASPPKPDHSRPIDSEKSSPECRGFPAGYPTERVGSPDRQRCVSAVWDCVTCLWELSGRPALAVRRLRSRYSVGRALAPSGGQAHRAVRPPLLTRRVAPPRYHFRRPDSGVPGASHFRRRLGRRRGGFDGTSRRVGCEKQCSQQPLSAAACLPRAPPGRTRGEGRWRVQGIAVVTSSNA